MYASVQVGTSRVQLQQNATMHVFIGWDKVCDHVKEVGGAKHMLNKKFSA